MAKRHKKQSRIAVNKPYKPFKHNIGLRQLTQRLAHTIGHKTMNRLLNHIITERKGHYCHALELDSAYSYESVIEQIVSEYKDSFSLDEIIDFFKSISLYYYYDADSDDEEHRLTEEQQEIAEEELYNFDYIQCINDCYY